MPVETAPSTLDQIALSASDRQMTHLVALKANFRVAIEAVVGVFSTENARLPLGVIGTVLAPMAILPTVFALGRRISLMSEVAPLLINQFQVLGVTLIILAAFFLGQHWLLPRLRSMLLRCRPIEFLVTLAEVEVPLEEAIPTH